MAPVEHGRAPFAAAYQPINNHLFMPTETKANLRRCRRRQGLDVGRMHTVSEQAAKLGPLLGCCFAAAEQAPLIAYVRQAA
jgi:hypothetical protein